MYASLHTDASKRANVRALLVHSVSYIHPSSTGIKMPEIQTLTVHLQRHDTSLLQICCM